MLHSVEITNHNQYIYRHIHKPVRNSDDKPHRWVPHVRCVILDRPCNLQPVVKPGRVGSERSAKVFPAARSRPTRFSRADIYTRGEYSSPGSIGRRQTRKRRYLVQIKQIDVVKVMYIYTSKIAFLYRGINQDEELSGELTIGDSNTASLAIHRARGGFVVLCQSIFVSVHLSHVSALSFFFFSDINYSSLLSSKLSSLYTSCCSAFVSTSMKPN